VEEELVAVSSSITSRTISVAVRLEEIAVVEELVVALLLV
jgi:hypothetical protein